MPVEDLVKNIPLGQLAVCLNTVAIEGLTDEELSDSGEEGMYRERDEFVVKNEDIESLQVCDSIKLNVFVIYVCVTFE